VNAKPGDAYKLVLDIHGCAINVIRQYNDEEYNNGSCLFEGRIAAEDRRHENRKLRA